MDVLVLTTTIAAGSLVGLLAGLLPGLHVNTVCAVALAAALASGPLLAVGLCAVAVSHAFAALLPSTYLGAPGEETLLSALPAHRMLLEGRGPDAVQAGLDGGLAGLALAVAVVLPYKWLLGEPGRALEAVDAAMPWILGAILAALVVRERRRGWAAMAWASIVLLLSGVLGMLGTRVPVAALVPVATSPLLPMLSGLFGAPALIETLRARPHVPDQAGRTRAPARIRRLSMLGMVSGVAAAAATAVLPGLTSSVAAAAARTGQHDDDARPLLATLSAIATSHVVFTFVVLWMSLRARTGLAVAVQQTWRVDAWTAGAAPLPLRVLLLTCVAAGLAGYVLASAVARPASRLLPRLPQQAVAAAALAVLVAIVALFSGVSGLGLFAVATLLGLLPLAAGLGRIHLTGCLLVPVLAHRLA